MTWRPQPLPPVPEATVAAVRAAFPQGIPTSTSSRHSARSMMISSLPIYTLIAGVPSSASGVTGPRVVPVPPVVRAPPHTGLPAR
jgi:hypothetical protein